MSTVGCSDNEATPPTDQTGTDTPVAGDQSEAPPEDELPVPYQQLMTDRLVDADYWQEEPAILAAGLGFTDINGVPGLSDPNLSLTEIEAMVRDAGAGWHNVASTAPVDEIDLRARTSAASLFGITQVFGYPSPNSDGRPMELSHPVLASTVHREDIAVHLNTGEVITPDNISVMPNGEYNERSTLVMNGAFEAKGLAFGEGATPLTAYRPGQGPRLCAAKLTMADAGLAGKGAPGTIQSGSFPNDLRSL